MSRVVTVKCTVRDPELLRKTCSELGLAEPRLGEHEVGPDRYWDTKPGYRVDLPDFEWPAVYNCERGDVYTYPGIEKSAIFPLVGQRYAVESIRQAAIANGVTLGEPVLNEYGIYEIEAEYATA